MECHLKNHPLELFQPIETCTVTLEETAELIVPDSCPDILRIVDSWGTACLKEKEIQPGSVRLNGIVRAVTLYVPESGRGVRKLEIQIPVSTVLDHPMLTPESKVLLEPLSCTIHTRIANPRKLSVNAQVKVRVRLFAFHQLLLTDGVEGAQEQGIQCKTRELSFDAICSIRDKTFTLSEELDLPAGKPPLTALVRTDVQLTTSEMKTVGGKLVLKGNAALRTLYLSGDEENCTLAAVNHEIPFSQVIELELDAESEIRGQVSLFLSALDLYSVGGEGESRTLSVSLGITAQVCAVTRCSEVILADLYSTQYDLTSQQRPMTLTLLEEAPSKRTTLRESMEAGTVPNEILDMYVSCDEVFYKPAENSLNCDAVVSVLYSGEDHQLYSVSRHLPIICDAGECAPGAKVIASAQLCGEAMAIPSSGGIDVRFPVEFFSTVQREEALSCFDSVSLEQKEESGRPTPSVLLRRAGKGEDLWTIAKSCCTTREALRQANQMDGEELEEGMMLLIPKAR